MSENEQDPNGRYLRLPEELGRGAYKVVYRALDRDNGIEVAWNQIRLEQGTDFEKLWKEIVILQQLKHPNVIVFHHSWVDEVKLQVVFITELMTSGTLKQYLKRANRSLKLRVIKNWCLQILEGLNYLHTRNPPIIHRDIKCDNIFVNGNQGQVKIGDLGLATVLSEAGAQLKQSIIGTPEFMAPEYYDEVYTEKVDIWAFGMCVLEMATLDYPYAECDNPAQIFKKVSTGIRPKGLGRIADPEVFRFIDCCLLPVDKRPSAGQLIKHPFFNNMNDDVNNREIAVRNEEDTLAFMELIRTNNVPAEYKWNYNYNPDAQPITPQPTQQQPPSTPPVNGGGKDTSDLTTSKETGVPSSGGNTPKASPRNPPKQYNDTNSQQQDQSSSNVNSGGSIQLEEGAGSDSEEEEEDSSSESEGEIGQHLNASTSPNGGIVPIPLEDSFDDEEGGDENGSNNTMFLQIDTDANASNTSNNRDPFVVNLKFSLGINGTNQIIAFEYHLLKDTPQQVASEMVKELQLGENSVTTIGDYIEAKVEDYVRAHSLAVPSITGASSADYAARKMKRSLQGTEGNQPLRLNSPRRSSRAGRSGENHQHHLGGSGGIGNNSSNNNQLSPHSNNNQQPLVHPTQIPYATGQQNASGVTKKKHRSSAKEKGRKSSKRERNRTLSELPKAHSQADLKYNPMKTIGGTNTLTGLEQLRTNLKKSNSVSEGVSTTSNGTGSSHHGGGNILNQPLSPRDRAIIPPQVLERHEAERRSLQLKTQQMAERHVKEWQEFERRRMGSALDKPVDLHEDNLDELENFKLIASANSTNFEDALLAFEKGLVLGNDSDGIDDNTRNSSLDFIHSYKKSKQKRSNSNSNGNAPGQPNSES